MTKTDEQKAQELLAHVRAFIKEQRINCAEAVYQCDWVIENAYEFIEKCADIVGYHEEEE